MRGEYDDDSTADYELWSAMKRGTLGWYGSIVNVSGQALVAIRAEPEAACDWVVTIAAMTLASMTGGNGSIAPGTPLANQVRTFFGQAGGVTPPEVTNYGISGLYLTVQWGMGNVVETAFVSYPWAGSSFVVHGSTVLVNLPQAFQVQGLANGDGIPNIGAMVSPRARRDAVLSPPTLRAQTKPMAAQPANVATFFRPPRACGYRLYTQVNPDAFAPAPTYLVREAFWNAGGLTPDTVNQSNADILAGDAATALDIGAAGANAWQRATGNALNWTRLMPTSVALQVTQGTADAVSLGVEWLLDLG